MWWRASLGYDDGWLTTLAGEWEKQIDIAPADVYRPLVDGNPCPRWNVTAYHCAKYFARQGIFQWAIVVATLIVPPWHVLTKKTTCVFCCSLRYSPLRVIAQQWPAMALLVEFDMYGMYICPLGNVSVHSGNPTPDPQRGMDGISWPRSEVLVHKQTSVKATSRYHIVFKDEVFLC